MPAAIGTTYTNPNNNGVYHFDGYWNPTTTYLGAFTDNNQTQARPGGGDEVLYAGAYWLASYYSVGVNPTAGSFQYGYWQLAPKTPSGGTNTPVYTKVVPNAPTGLTSGYKSTSEVALFWNPAYVPGYGTVSSYSIYDNGSQIGTSTTTSFAVTGLAAGSTNVFQVYASDEKGTSASAATMTVVTNATQPASTGKYFSPYVDVTLPTTDLLSISAASGLRDFTLAFMTSSDVDNSGNWIPGTVPTVSWGGLPALTEPTGTIIQEVKALEAQGGTITVSFGGYGGRDPAYTSEQYAASAGTAAAAKNLQAEYQSVITTYGVNHLDFDIESDSMIVGGTPDPSTNYNNVTDTVQAGLRNTALVALEAANPDLKVSFTVAVEPTGLTQDDYNLIATAINAGVRIDTVNLMAMDYGVAVPNMAQAAISAAKDTWAQLTTGGTFAGITYAGLGLTSTKVGITPMVGQNDTLSEVFTAQDAQTLESFAASTPWVAGLGEWEIPRDHPHSKINPAVDGASVNGSTTNLGPAQDASGVAQTEYQFSKTLNQIQLATGAHVGVSDFNADAVSDILFRNESNGAIGYSTINSNGTSTTFHALGTSSTSYAEAGVGDFNNDGLADILFRSSNGSLGYDTINSNGTSVTFHAIGASSTSYAVSGVGDFNGDGLADILFRSSNGSLGYDTINSNGTSTTFHAIGASGTAYAVAGVGDFDDDGKSDILFRNNSTGALGYDTINSNGTSTTFHSIGTSSTAYAVAGVADFNHDGLADILFRNSSNGALGYDTINSNGTSTTFHSIGTSNTAYAVVGTGDYSGEGVSDILFRNNSTGALGYDTINSNGTSTTFHAIGTSGASYTVKS